MTFINPSAVERDNQNAQRKYPFSDAAEAGNGTSVIVPGAIIDAQLYVPGRDAGRVWLSSVDTDGKLHFSDDAGEFAETAAAASADCAVPIVFTGTGSKIPGGVVVFGNKGDVAALMSACGQSFTADQTELAPAAVTWVGLPGVYGFKLDDGNVVCGNVKFKGENGCDVATYIKDKTCFLRISAIGQVSSSVTSTGFITKIVADSDNSNFVVSNSTLSDYVIEILATGVSTTIDDDLNADQYNVCATVRKKIGTVPSDRATTPPDCGKGVCKDPVFRTITFNDGTEVVGTLSVYDGYDLKQLESRLMPKASHIPTGMRFTGYFDKEQDSDETPKKLYYRADGSGIGKFTAGTDVTLYAHWMSSSSHAEVTVGSYGTLHLSAPDVSLVYTNPLVISGSEMPTVVNEIPDEALEKGGSEVLSEIVLHPAVPSGEVHIGIRGLNKAYAL